MTLQRLATRPRAFQADQDFSDIIGIAHAGIYSSCENSRQPLSPPVIVSEIMADYILTIDNQFSVEFSWYMNSILGGKPHVIPKKTRAFGEMWFYVNKTKQTYEYVLPMLTERVKVIVANDSREGPVNGCRFLHIGGADSRLQMLNILLTGRDTMMSVLVFVVYFSSVYPAIFMRLRAEILEHVGASLFSPLIPFPMFRITTSTLALRGSSC
ncbi:hypothetical protein B0H14DRAFT_3463559 [Mycena olivaceomarginata]|nr:hypothetical protein B0H14DRAFT_3463559 [Mycena olivaceomarginata]